MSKEEVGAKIMSNSFVFSELFAIIAGDGVHTISNGSEQIDHGVADHFGCTAVNFLQQSQTRFTFRQRNNGLAMSFANNGIHFPIPNPLTMVNNLRALFNASAIGQITPAVTMAVAIAAFLLAAQVLGQVTTGSFIAQNVLIIFS